MKQICFFGRFWAFFILFFSLNLELTHSNEGFFIGYKTGFSMKIDVASGFDSKSAKNMDSIPVGIGEYGVADPHKFPRIIEPKAGVYGDMTFFWGYRFPKVFSAGFGFWLSNFMMPYLTFIHKFSFLEKNKIQPFAFIELYGGFLDGFPIGVTVGGGVDFFITSNVFLLIENKAGAEIFVSRYYDDGVNSNPIWHWDSLYSYGVYSLYVGIGYRFDNKKKPANRRI